MCAAWTMRSPEGHTAFMYDPTSLTCESGQESCWNTNGHSMNNTTVMATSILGTRKTLMTVHDFCVYFKDHNVLERKWKLPNFVLQLFLVTFEAICLGALQSTLRSHVCFFFAQWDPVHPKRPKGPVGPDPRPLQRACWGPSETSCRSKAALMTNFVFQVPKVSLPVRNKWTET